MLRSISVFLLAARLAISAGTSITVDELVSFVKSSIEKHYPDKDVADYLRTVKLANKLEERTIEDLRAAGAGPKTEAALDALRNSSANLAAAPAPVVKAAAAPPASPPDLTEQGKIIQSAREYALNYTSQLPNYLCLQVTRRYVDNSTLHQPGSEDWKLMDTFASRLTYFEQKEDYKVIMVNNSPVQNSSMDRLGGAVSLGEFGSMMRQIFEPASEARFDWDHWGTLRGHPTYVFRYDIDRAHSQFHIIWEREQNIAPAYLGLIYIDKDTNEILRVTEEAYNIDPGFPVRAVIEVLDYDSAKIGDGQFLVPQKAVVTSRTTKYLSRNEVEFRLYQKYGADATIKFEDIPPQAPEDKPKQ